MQALHLSRQEQGQDEEKEGERKKLVVVVKLLKREEGNATGRVSRVIGSRKSHSVSRLRWGGSWRRGGGVVLEDGSSMIDMIALLGVK